MADSEIADYKFIVKEGNPTYNGAPWLACEPENHELSIVGDGSLGLRLREGTTLEQAQELARLLQQRVAGLKYTPAG